MCLWERSRRYNAINITLSRVNRDEVGLISRKNQEKSHRGQCKGHGRKGEKLPRTSQIPRQTPRNWRGWSARCPYCSLFGYRRLRRSDIDGVSDFQVKIKATRSERQ